MSRARTLSSPASGGGKGGVFVTVDGERRQITEHEAVVHQLVNKSAAADLQALVKLATPLIIPWAVSPRVHNKALRILRLSRPLGG